jgi:hypothetical protein
MMMERTGIWKKFGSNLMYIRRSLKTAQDVLKLDALTVIYPG